MWEITPLNQYKRSNICNEEINIRLSDASQCLYSLKILFKSKLLSRKTKEHIFISYSTIRNINGEIRANTQLYDIYKRDVI